MFNEFISDQEVLAFARSMVAKKHPVQIHHIRQCILNTDKNIRVGFAHALPDLKNEWAIINSLTFPVGLIGADMDIVVNQEYMGMKLPKRNLWNKDVSMLIGCGHYLPIEVPEAIASIIHEYIDSFMSNVRIIK